jgi:kinesin family protein 6/9
LGRYKSRFQQLKELKIEIEHLQHLLEGAKRRLNADFDEWISAQSTLRRFDRSESLDSANFSDHSFQREEKQGSKHSAWATSRPQTPVERRTLNTLSSVRLSSAMGTSSISSANSPSRPTSAPKPAPALGRSRSKMAAEDIAAFYAARDKVCPS